MTVPNKSRHRTFTCVAWLFRSCNVWSSCDISMRRLTTHCICRSSWRRPPKQWGYICNTIIVYYYILLYLHTHIIYICVFGIYWYNIILYHFISLQNTTYLLCCCARSSFQWAQQTAGVSSTSESSRVSSPYFVTFTGRLLMGCQSCLAAWVKSAGWLACFFC
jgi:hypothetical protein